MWNWSTAFKDNIRHEPMVSLGNPFELPRLLNKLGWRVISACTDLEVSLFSELRTLQGFGRYLLSMTRNHGSTYTVKYLKACHLALQKCISRDRINSLREIEPDLPLPRLSASRLPRFIPLAHRRAILADNSFRIRYWLTLFSIYRVIRIPGILKLNTITDPFSGDVEALSRGCEDLKTLVSRHLNRFDLSLLSKEYGLRPLETASPTSKSSWRGFLTDVSLLVKTGLNEPLESLLSSFSQYDLLLRFIMIKDAISKGFPFHNPAVKTGYENLGQLAIKEEAAGKLRVFALVDVWTQNALYPLHKTLFAFLKGLPNDGTFDQFAAVQRAAQKASKFNCSFGYDLSAATDRLPIDLQVAVLSPIIGEKAAIAWKTLLVSRPYKLDDISTPVDDTFFYAVGQPMGALSSWAMLALTHHLIVQQAHLNVRGIPFEKGVPNLSFWYSEYEILGDDIVLFEEDIALEYLRLMTSFGVGINLSKSVVAKNASFEFAKVSWIKGNFVSAISWKMFISQNNNMGRVNILYQLLPKMNLKHPIRYLKRVLSKSILDEGNIKFNLLATLSMFANSGRIALNDLLATLLNPMDKPRRSILKDTSFSLNETYASTLITDLVYGRTLHLRSDKIIQNVHEKDIPWYHIALLAHITKIKNELGSWESIIQRLTDRMVDSLIPDTYNLKEKGLYFNFYNWVLEEITDLWKDEEIVFKRNLYFMIRSWVENLLGDDQFYETGSVDPKVSTLDDLILVTEKFDRLIEVLKLIDRSDEKIAGLTKARVSDKSPLRVLYFLLKVDKLRADIVRRENSRWFVDRSEERFIEETEFLLREGDLIGKVRVRYL